MTLAINIDAHYTSKIYTTGSRITGSVSLFPKSDAAIQSIQIALVGTSRTRVDSLPAPRVTNHVFLTLDMPITKASRPSVQDLEGGSPQNIPFRFIIPHTLPRDPCETSRGAGQLRDQHLRLPPTMGTWEKDDLAPTMARVDYAVVARVFQRRSSGTDHAVEQSQPIKVLPMFPMDPPLSITPQDTRYKLERTKLFRRRVLSARKERITVTTAQPEAVRLGVDGHHAPGSWTSVMLDLNFESSSPSFMPPEALTIQMSLESQTWYAAAPIRTLPDLGNPRDSTGLRHELRYSTTTKLSRTQAEGMAWTRKSAAAEWALSSWRAKVKVPIHLPTTHKLFLPTFYGCFVSRSYMLHISVESNGTSLNLSVPVQIATQSPHLNVLGESLEDPPSFESALAWR
ncbi:hypothetical protein CCHL11_07154 [Colletotrichum chlorophyti]|uniref:Arrestin-like N-terminal domain-containing protein n=1 Tax=Colletotrichum chlorophyti TaxID=708187 RepID=A0A1Q8S0Q2_9PEZI|nr:hypothetical protein CCHL11_07154 [Colletotrichum chlorophyti]